MNKLNKLDYLKSPLSTFYFAIYPYRLRFFIMIVLAIVGNIFGYSLPYFLKLIVDRVSAGPITTFDDLWLPFSLVAWSLVTQELCFRLGHIIETYTAPDSFKNITTSLYHGLIKRPTSYFENRFSGDLGRRIEQVGSSVRYFVEAFPWEVGWIGMAMIMSAVVLGLAHPYIFITFLLWLIFFILTSIPILKWHFSSSQKVASSHAHLSGSMIDTLNNINLVQSFGAVKFEQFQNEKVTKEVVEEEHKMQWVSIANKFHCGMSIALLGISLTYVSVLLFVKGDFTVGDFVLVAATIPSLVGVVWTFGEVVIQASRNFGELSDAVSYLKDKQEQLVGGDVVDFNNQEFSIEFKDIYFQYTGTSSPIFNNFSLNIKQGEKVGIVGASGAGKSTLIKLLLRQYEFNAGNILIGGVSIRAFSLDTFHKFISYVPQDTSLFHRSLFENIIYAKTNSTRDEVLEASKKANADDFIKTLPQGYDTKVGEKGVKLSGGQRQRIALARAILKNAPILILDEATSSLDTESEVSIQDALSKLFKDRTVIAIAHRLVTLRAMDRIVVIENGLVAEDGAPNDLLQKSEGIFKKMWDNQKNGFIT